MEYENGETKYFDIHTSLWLKAKDNTNVTLFNSETQLNVRVPVDITIKGYKNLQFVITSQEMKIKSTSQEMHLQSNEQPSLSLTFGDNKSSIQYNKNTTDPIDVSLSLAKKWHKEDRAYLHFHTNTT